MNRRLLSSSCGRFSPAVRQGWRAGAAILLSWGGLLLSGTSPAMAGQAMPSSQAQVEAVPALPGPLSLDEAITLAQARSQQVAIARAAVDRAGGGEVQARSQLFPQLNGSASYDRTLASEFEGLFSGGAAASCPPFTLTPGASLEERVAEIERAIDCGAVGNPFSGLGNLPFGQRNVYRVNLSFSQAIYTGGRVGAARALARAGSTSAEVGLATARAQLALDVTQAFYDAALSDRLVAIAEATLKQAEATLAQVELSQQAGRTPEFDTLRARVTRDNLRPVLIRAEAGRTLAYLRLKQLLELPPGAGVVLDVTLDDPQLPPPPPFALALAEFERAGGEVPAARASVRQAASAVDAQQASLRVARSERLPSVSFSSSYGRVAYPSGAPSFGDFRTNWTVGVLAQVPILTGGRLRGDEMVARADLAEARARLALTEQLVRIDTRAAFEQLRAAQSAWEAVAGTVEQAARAYQIAELRYREGVSTQLELADARLALEQAQVNRAQAARDLQVARARAALLPDLPLGASEALAAAATAQAAAGSTPGAGSGGQAGLSAASPAGGGQPGGMGTAGIGGRSGGMQ